MSGRHPTPGRDPADTRDERRGSRTRTWWLVAGAVGVAVAVLVVVGVSGGSDTATEPEAGTSAAASQEAAAASSVPGEPNGAAYVEMQDFDGNTLTIASLSGRPLVVNFWATWCPACFAEMPAFEKAYQASGGSVQFLGINLSEDIETALSIIDETGVTYPLARDPQGEVFTAFGGYGMPTTVFLDGSGTVIEMYTGELTVDELEARIVEYFGS